MSAGGRPKDKIWADFERIDKSCSAKCCLCGEKVSAKAARLHAHKEKCKGKGKTQISSVDSGQSTSGLEQSKKRTLDAEVCLIF